MAVTFETLEETAQMLVQSMTDRCLAQLLNQFQNLLNAGVLGVKRHTPTVALNRTPDGKLTLEFSSNVELSFRGEEEIERLKAENNRLGQKLLQISGALKGVL